MSGHTIEKLNNVSLARLHFLPGRSLTAYVAGIAETKSGGHAIVECSIHFDGITSATIDLECVPAPLFSDPKPWFIQGLGDRISPTESGALAERTLQFASGRIATHASRRIVSLVRFDLLSEEESQKYQDRS
jgi:hypothetical protein